MSLESPVVKYRVLEDQLTLIGDSKTKEAALDVAKACHLESPDKYHEVYRIDADNTLHGIAQWKPGDCEHHMPWEECSACGNICNLCPKQSAGNVWRAMKCGFYDGGRCLSATSGSLNSKRTPLY